MKDFTENDYKNLETLLSRLTDIKGSEAITVALILQKVSFNLAQFELDRQRAKTKTQEEQIIEKDTKKKANK